MSNDVEASFVLTPLTPSQKRSAAACVSSQPDAALLLTMLGLDGVAP
jgi:hypothetical protein